MVSVLASSVVYRGFEPRSGQTKDLKIGIWLARNQAIVSEWGDMSIRVLLFQWACTKKNPTKSVGQSNLLSTTLELILDCTGCESTNNYGGPGGSMG